MILYLFKTKEYKSIDKFNKPERDFIVRIPWIDVDGVFFNTPWYSSDEEDWIEVWIFPLSSTVRIFSCESIKWPKLRFRISFVGSANG